MTLLRAALENVTVQRLPFDIIFQALNAMP